MAVKKKFFDNKKPLIIAEIASAHLGKSENVISLLKEANRANFDAIKFQIFKTDNFISKFNKYFKILKKLEINYQNWNNIFNKTKKIKIKKICEIFEYESLVFAHKSKYFDAYKISSSNIYENRIYQYILKNNLPFIINISGLKIYELNKIYQKIENKDFCMMIGFQNFPTKVKDINLNKISFLKNKFNDVCIGYADHTDSKIDILPISIPMMALAKGANVIEKHINIDRSKKKNDYFSSLDPKEFLIFISSIKKGYLSQGSKNFNILKSEIKYLNFAKKYMVASRNLPKGQIITDKDINFKRTNQKGIDENDFKSLKKIKLNKAIKADSIIKKNDLKK